MKMPCSVHRHSVVAASGSLAAEPTIGVVTAWVVATLVVSLSAACKMIDKNGRLYLARFSVCPCGEWWHAHRCPRARTQGANGDVGVGAVKGVVVSSLGWLEI
jgi:hypothetical protein